MRRLVIVAWVAACGSDPQPRAIANAPARDADVITIDAPPVRFTGVLTAAESVDVAPRIAGVIAKVHVGAGDVVEAGQIVAEMDPSQMRDELRAAEAALAASTAASRQAAVDVEDARRKLALETKAVEKGVSPAQNLEEARLGVKRAEAAQQRARSNQTAEAVRAETAKNHVNDTDLRAPFAGTVAMRYRDAGNRVEGGTPIVKIVGHGSMRLRFAVPPQLASSVAVGRNVTASVETIATPIVATIKQVSPALDPASGMIIVEAELPNTEGIDELRPGLSAWVRP